MAITLVQAKSSNSGSVASTNPLSVVLDAPPTPGNTLVLVASVLSSVGNIGITSDPNITWVYWIGQGANNTGIILALGRVFAGASSTITVIPNNLGGTAMAVAEYSGANISYDRFISITGTSINPTTGTTGTTSKATQLWVGAIAVRNSVTFSAPTNGFTILLQDRSVILGTQDRSVALLTFPAVAIGTASTTTTVSTSSIYYGAMVTLQENPTGGGGGETTFGSST